MTSCAKGHIAVPEATFEYDCCTIQTRIRIKNKDLFIGPQEFAVGYSKAPEPPQSSARPMYHSHTMTNTGREPATIRIAVYRSSPRYALLHGRRQNV